MKISKRKLMMIGLAATTLFHAGGCTNAEGNEESTVYGPPVDFEMDADENEEPTSTVTPTTADEVPEVEIEVEDNEPADVYGPPVDFEEDGPDLDVGDNVLENVYGPPVDFEDEPQILPDENLTPLIYGPPEDFQ